MQNSDLLICELFNYNEIINIIDIDNIIALLIEEYKLEDYIYNFGCKKMFLKSGVYYPKKKELFYDYDGMLRDILRNYEILFGYQNGVLQKKYFNANILLTIFHEIEHAKQTKYAYESDGESVLSKVVQEGIELGSRLPHNVSLNEYLTYKIHYSSILTERNAEINAYLNLLEIDDFIKYLSVMERKHYYNILKDKLKKDYSDISTPLKYYYYFRDKLEEYNNFDLSSINENQITRLAWGLPISNLTLKYLNDDLNIEMDEKTFKEKLLKIK